MSELIDRQAAIDEAYDVVVDGEVFKVVQVETLLALPSAQPDKEQPTIDAVEVRHGEWTYENHGWSSFPKCSCCGEMQTIGTNYCPNCGAKMDGEERR